MTISNEPTANMKCTAHLCKPTASDAVLNATDLQSLLSAGNVTIQSLNTADDIFVEAPLTWSSGVTLTLNIAPWPFTDTSQSPALAVSQSSRPTAIRAACFRSEARAT